MQKVKLALPSSRYCMLFLPPGWEAQEFDFQYSLSSPEIQQPVDLVRHKSRGCLALNVLC